MTITTKAEYENALQFAQEMSGAPEDTPEEQLLIRTVLAIEIWEAKQPLFGNKKAPASVS